jgi:predicted kinase
MTHLFDHCPAAPGWRVNWDELDREYPFVRALAGCPQDPVHHAEGDVWIHTRMVCEALVALEGWRQLDEDNRRILFAAAVLHDVAKPECTRTDQDGRITSRGHSRRGAIVARNLLWRMHTPFAQREQVAALIRHHQSPYFLIDRPDPRRLAIEISQTARGNLLSLLAEADVRGRICDDQQRLLDNVGLFAEQLREMGCLDRAYEFPSDHARVLFFLDEKRIPEAPAHEQFRCDVVLMSGLPGAGKDHFIRTHLSDRTVIALDELRDELDIDPDEAQGKVINEARDRARELLRRGEPFVWNATNVSRQLRRLVLELFAQYQARIRIVYVEAPPETLFEQNRQRQRRVPAGVIERLLDRWEVPDRTEAHAVEWHVRGEPALTRNSQSMPADVD